MQNKHQRAEVARNSHNDRSCVRVCQKCWPQMRWAKSERQLSKNDRHKMQKVFNKKKSGQGVSVLYTQKIW